MKFSIITPSYNQGQYLEANILSVLNQDNVEVEHIVIDGGSNDESKAVLEKYSNKLTYWVSEKDNGQTHAINKGLAVATGDIITWINSDDQLIPHTLQNVQKYFLEHPNAALIHGQTKLVNTDGSETISSGQRDGIPYRYAAGMCFPQPSSFFRKTALNKVGFPNEALHFGMDYDLFLRMFLIDDFVPVEDVLSVYLLHEDSKTMTSDVKFADDWARIFSTLLSSAKNVDVLITQMSFLGLYHPFEDKYVIEKELEMGFFVRAFQYHLLYQLYYRYEGYDLKNVKKLAKFIKREYPAFYEQYHIKSYKKRSAIPKPFLKALRNKKRKNS